LAIVAMYFDLRVSALHIAISLVAIFLSIRMCRKLIREN
jgi:hypothetical protein